VSNPKVDALSYGGLGWHVVPVHTPTRNGGCSCGHAKCISQGKHPRISEWEKNATDNEEQIKKWWNQWPDANVGVQLGQKSGIIDVEFDDAKGEQTADRLFADCDTPTFFSDRSTHRIFTWTAKLPRETKIEVDGLDFRLGNNKAAQSVFPTSLRVSGKNYRWADGLHPLQVSPIELPADVLRLLSQESTEIKKASDDGGMIPEKTRNTRLTSIAGSYRRNGCDATAIYGALSAVNQGRCQPPLPDAEVQEIARSVARYEPSAFSYTMHGL
jgi:putative DNA primase/helicase